MTKVLITPQIDNDRKHSLFCDYTDAITMAGAMPIIMPYANDENLINEYLDMCEGVVFSGGADVNPALYGEEALPECGVIEHMRDELEAKVFRLAYARKMPILAICRGAQLCNILLGGSMYQDIPSQCPSQIRHSQTEGKYLHSHSVSVLPGTPLYDIAKSDRIRINSFHHQALKRVADGLTVMARSDDGIVEALYAEDYPFMRLYQWHPERLCQDDDIMRGVFLEFTEYIKRGKL